MDDKVEGFFGEYRWLSNFYPSEVEVDGNRWPDVETAYQVLKLPVSLSDYNDWMEKFKECKRPGEAKKLGRNCPLSPSWESNKLTIMKSLVRQKFQRHKSLREKLLATKDWELEETNNWGDRYWGRCGGVGENHLGRILMEVREEIRGTE